MELKEKAVELTPKEKAIELFNTFYGIPLYVKTVKESCNIAVNEILSMPIMKELYAQSAREYWEEVKLEIQDIKI